jgi:hypothetical protein
MVLIYFYQSDFSQTEGDFVCHIKKLYLEQVSQRRYLQ